MIVYPPAEQILPGEPRPGKSRIVAVVVIVLVLAAMGWDAVDIQNVLAPLLAVFGMEMAAR